MEQQTKYTITQSRIIYVLSTDDSEYENLIKVGEIFTDNANAGESEDTLKHLVRRI